MTPGRRKRVASTKRDCAERRPDLHYALGIDLVYDLRLARQQDEHAWSFDCARVVRAQVQQRHAPFRAGFIERGCGDLRQSGDGGAVAGRTEGGASIGGESGGDLRMAVAGGVARELGTAFREVGEGGGDGRAARIVLGRAGCCSKDEHQCGQDEESMFEQGAYAFGQFDMFESMLSQNGRFDIERRGRP